MKEPFDVSFHFRVEIDRGPIFHPIPLKRQSPEESDPEWTSGGAGIFLEERDQLVQINLRQS